MKEYKQKKSNYFYLSDYVLNYEFHGFCYSYTYKGYYNMGMEYSHWLEAIYEFKYYL